MIWIGSQISQPRMSPKTRLKQWTLESKWMPSFRKSSQSRRSGPSRWENSYGNGKRLLRLNKADVSKSMVAMRQLGVGIAGGGEALAIFQQLLFDTWADGQIPKALARIKVDEKNCFGSFEWGAIRSATIQTLPHHAAVASWKHSQQSFVEQDGVEAVPKDRGAEQGDVDGPLEASLVLGQIAATARQTVHSAQRSGDFQWAVDGADAKERARAAYDDHMMRAAAWQAATPAQRQVGGPGGTLQPSPDNEVQQGGGLADFWYLDDGDIICDPLLVLPHLKAFDQANAPAGAQRNLIKTEVVLLASEEEIARNSTAWNLEQVRALATVKSATDPGITLGVATGELQVCKDQLLQKVEVNRSMQQKVQICADAQTEHVLNRQCLGINKVNHILRVHGEALWRDREILASFDENQRTTLDRLFPGLTEEGHKQAVLGASVGGLGWRSATDTALPANLAALTLAAPKIRAMAESMVTAGLLPAGILEAKLAAKIESVEVAFMPELDPGEQVKAQDFLTRAEQGAQQAWQALVEGSPGDIRGPRADAEYSRPGDVPTASSSVTEDGGSADPESSNTSMVTSHVQGQLSRLADCTRLRKLEATLKSLCRWPQLKRLKELRHKEVSHAWLWHLNPLKGSVMSEADYVAGVQKRLGAKILCSECACRLCGKPLDPHLDHSEVCCIGEATRGHYAVVRAVVDGLRIADSAVTTEPRGLTSTQARPADIFTSAAVPGRSAALDVCIASPDAASAGEDAVQTAFKRKLHHYRNVIPELHAAGIAFRPLIWSADGRPHPAATRTLKYAADIAARKRGGAAAPGLLARWKHEITVAIVRRRAAMVRAVQPPIGVKELWMLTGVADEGGFGMEGRLAVIDED